MKSLCKGKLVPSVSWQWSCSSVKSGYLLKQEFPMDIKDADIPRKNLVKQGSQAAKLVTNGQAFKFRYNKQLLISSPLFCVKRFSASRPFSWFKVTKARSAGEPILIMLVSKETIAIAASISRSPTSHT